MIRYRGKRATKRLDKLRKGEDLVITLPQEADDQALHVGDKYKHLGSMLTESGNQGPEAAL